MDAAPDAPVNQCDDPPAGFPPGVLPLCPSCGAGRCVSRGMIPEEAQSLLAECSATHLCVPDEIIRNPLWIPDTCTSTFGAEGRCVSKCLPGVAAFEGRLPQDTCPDTHLCSPCFDPFDGTSTGACDQECDPGPSEPPVLVTECCDGAALCIPTDSVPAESRGLFRSCDGAADTLCVPNEVVSTPDYVPPTCSTGAIGDTFGEEFRAGVCLSPCLPAVAATSAALEQNDCADATLCVPCNDPDGGGRTGACDGAPPPMDGGVPDGGVTDAGAMDAGSMDAGSMDAGGDGGGDAS